MCQHNIGNLGIWVKWTLETWALVNLGPWEHRILATWDSRSWEHWTLETLDTWEHRSLGIKHFGNLDPGSMGFGEFRTMGTMELGNIGRWEHR